MRIKSFPTDLTFDEFKSFADVKPDTTSPGIYRLEQKVKDFDDDYSHYPIFTISTHEFFFLSLEEAEKYMREKLLEKDDNYRFCITHILPGAETWGANTTFIYDKDGTLVDYCSYVWDEEKNGAVFCGRTESRIRFKKGDIVEIVRADEVKLGIVAAEGPTVEWFWDLYQRTKDKYGYPSDETDDCYYVLDGPGHAYHHHCNSCMLMPLSMPLDNEIRNYFLHCLECADKENSNPA